MLALGGGWGALPLGKLEGLLRLMCFQHWIIKITNVLDVDIWRPTHLDRDIQLFFLHIQRLFFFHLFLLVGG